MEVLNPTLETAPPGQTRTVTPGGPANFVFAGFLDGLFTPGDPAPVSRPEARDRRETPEPAERDDPIAVAPTETAPTRAEAPAPTHAPEAPGQRDSAPMAAKTEPDTFRPQPSTATGDRAAATATPTLAQPDTPPSGSGATPSPEEIATTDPRAPTTGAAIPASAAEISATTPTQTVDALSAWALPTQALPTQVATPLPTDATVPGALDIDGPAPITPIIVTKGSGKPSDGAPDQTGGQPVAGEDGKGRRAGPMAVETGTTVETAEDAPAPTVQRRGAHPGSTPSAGTNANAQQGTGETAADAPRAQVSSAEALAALVRPAVAGPRNLPAATLAGRAGGEVFTTQLVAGEGGESRTRIRIAPPPAPASAPRPAPVLDQIALQIRRAAADGLDRIRIQLKPADLGRVDVRLDIGNDGRVAALVTVDRAETLDLLQRDARGLERALEAAGLKPDAGNLQFSLGGGNGGNFAADLGGNGQPGGADGGDPAFAESAVPPPGTWTSDALLDIQV